MPICAEFQPASSGSGDRRRAAAERGDARARERIPAAPSELQRRGRLARGSARRRAPSRPAAASARRDVTTAGSRGSEIVISSQPSTCELSASRISQPWRARATASGRGRRRRSRSARSRSPTASVASKAARPARRSPRPPWRSASRKPVYASPVSTPNAAPSARILAVGALLEHARDEDHADEHDRDRDERRGLRPLAPDQPRDQPDEHDLRVAEHGREAGADLLDRVVPEHEVGRRRTRRRATRSWRARHRPRPQRRSSQRAISQSGGSAQRQR